MSLSRKGKKMTFLRAVLDWCIGALIAIVIFVATLSIYQGFVAPTPPYVSKYMGPAVTYVDHNARTVSFHYEVDFLQVCTVRFRRWVKNKVTNERILLNQGETIVTEYQVGKTFATDITIPIGALIPGTYELQPEGTRTCNLFERIFPREFSGRTIEFVVN